MLNRAAIHSTHYLQAGSYHRKDQLVHLIQQWENYFGTKSRKLDKLYNLKTGSKDIIKP